MRGVYVFQLTLPSPRPQNTPQRCPYGLYAEQLSGTAFTVPREHNQRRCVYCRLPYPATSPCNHPLHHRQYGLLVACMCSPTVETPPLFSWLYRIKPPVCHKPFKKLPQEGFTNDWSACEPDPNQVAGRLFPAGMLHNKRDIGSASPQRFPQMRWSPFSIPSEGEVDFVQGLHAVAGAGDPSMRAGCAVYVYTCNASMVDTAFYSSDGDFLIGELFGTRVPFRGGASRLLCLSDIGCRGCSSSARNS